MLSERDPEALPSFLPRTVDTLDTLVENGEGLSNPFLPREFRERYFPELSMLWGNGELKVLRAFETLETLETLEALEALVKSKGLTKLMAINTLTNQEVSILWILSIINLVNLGESS